MRKLGKGEVRLGINCKIKYPRMTGKSSMMSSSGSTRSWQREQTEEHEREQEQEQEQEQAEDHRVSHPSKAFGARSVNRCQNLIKTDWVLNGIVVHNTHTSINTHTHTDWEWNRTLALYDNQVVPAHEKFQPADRHIQQRCCRSLSLPLTLSLSFSF